MLRCATGRAAERWLRGVKAEVRSFRTVSALSAPYRSLVPRSTLSRLSTNCACSPQCRHHPAHVECLRPWHPPAQLFVRIGTPQGQTRGAHGETPRDPPAPKRSKRAKGNRQSAKVQSSAPFESLTHSDPTVAGLLDQARALIASYGRGRLADGTSSVGDNVEFEEYGSGGLSNKKVFANSYVNMSNVRAIGFDYDYTLVTYKPRMVAAFYNLAAEYLAQQLNYPSQITSFRYDPSFAIRGLGVDVRYGILVKLSSRLQISRDCAYFGREPLPRKRLEMLYGSQLSLSKSDRDQYIRPLLDRFSLAEACLLADVIQLLTDKKKSFDPSAVAADVSEALRFAHSSGRVHNAVVADLPAYIKPKPQLAAMLKSLRRDKKELFLASNSNFEFVSAGMTYLVGENWRKYFDVVIVSARKPTFYRANQPFRTVDPQTGKLDLDRVTHRVPDAVYSGGSIRALQHLTGWTGPDVLYFGDHLFADLVEARRAIGWHTGAIINDLDHELNVMSSPAYMQLAFSVTVMEEVLRLTQDLLYRPVGDEVEGWSQQRGIDEQDVQLLSGIEKEIKQRHGEMRTMFHGRFGSVFQAEYVSTYFGFTMHRYSDLYTSSLMNLAQYSNLANRRFYPPVQSLLPHEPLHPRLAIRNQLLQRRVS